MAKKEKKEKPFAKINFLTRKAKDERNIKMLRKTIDEGGSYSFKKKSNEPMEVMKGKFAGRRGTMVSGKTEKSVKAGPVKMTSETELKKGARSYTPEDQRTGSPKYGKESLTKPTPGFIKKGQEEGKQVVYKGGKPYRAGRYETDSPTAKTTTKASKPDITTSTKKSVTITTPPQGGMKQKFGKPMKRKMPHVEWLPQKRKKTESGYGK